MVVKLASKMTPPLENGDHLTRGEFERRYNAMPDNIKAELIEGIVYMASPVRAGSHGNPHADLLTWLAQYRTLTPGIDSSIDATIRFDDYNEPQPDAVLLIKPQLGGQVEYDELGYFIKAPELVAEISASTVSYDSRAKREVYRRFGVREYIIWRVYDEAIDWFVLRDGNYEAIVEDEDGIRRSTIFPGLWLDTAALLQGDPPAFFRVIQKGAASAEHAAFLKRLTSFS